MASVTLENSRAHVRAARQAKQSFAQYAREHGLSAQTLYAAHRLMKANGEIASTPTRPRNTTDSAFIPVHVVPEQSVTLRVVLPNGLALVFTGVNAPLLHLLASLP